MSLKLLVFLTCCFTFNLTYSQTGLKYECTNPALTGVVKEFDVGRNQTVSVNAYNIGKGAQMLVLEEIHGDSLIILLNSNSPNITGTENFAPIHKNYVMSKSMLKYFKALVALDHGLLAVPFKLRFSPVKIMAGGSLGYSVGARWNKFSLVGHGSLSPIALNDTTSTVPSTTIGISFGVGAIFRVADDFQIGIVEGQDLFEGVETWAYKFQPWLSFSVGYTFFTPNKKSINTALAK